jgi:hypothetical protein
MRRAAGPDLSTSSSNGRHSRRPAPHPPMAWSALAVDSPQRLRAAGIRQSPALGGHGRLGAAVHYHGAPCIPGPPGRNWRKSSAYASRARPRYRARNPARRAEAGDAAWQPSWSSSSSCGLAAPAILPGHRCRQRRLPETANTHRQLPGRASAACYLGVVMDHRIGDAAPPWGFKSPLGHNNWLCRGFCDVLRIVRCRGGLCRLRLVLGM